MTPGADEPPEFSIDDSYSVPGVGTVVSGTTLRGTIRLNDTLLLGPDPVGQFTPIAIKSIHRKRMPVKEVRGGQTASFALKKVFPVKSNITWQNATSFFDDLDQKIANKERNGISFSFTESICLLGIRRGNSCASSSNDN